MVAEVLRPGQSKWMGMLHINNTQQRCRPKGCTVKNSFLLLKFGIMSLKDPNFQFHSNWMLQNARKFIYWILFCHGIAGFFRLLRLTLATLTTAYN